ncbi:site-specific DNA-methyltransferase [Sneathia sanguinegens]|nr:site-specific DNA-methyltransferase [Sneathia sanguinegens]
MNISKEKREKLLNYLEKLKEGKEDEDIRIISEIEKALNEKKYGLVWEEHSEKVDEELKTNIPVFKEVKERKIEKDKEKAYNFLLEGDNLHSLRLLEKTHKGKIDVIYIDPPYNTGNKDFIYNDQYVDKTDGYSHSKWLSFMEKRLRIAKELLTEEGVIFISIDDNEQAQLKLLCDEIFGEEKYLATITVETSLGIFGPKAKHVRKSIVKNKDYLLSYAMNKDFIDLNPLYTKSKTLFDTHFTWYKDEDKEMSLVEFLKSNNVIKDAASKLNLSINISNLDRLMEVFPEVNKIIMENAENIYRIRDYTLNIPSKYSNDIEMGKKVKINDVYVYKENDKYLYLHPWAKLINKTEDYKSEVVSSVIVGDLWKGFNDDMGNVGKEGGVKFSNGKKPIRLIKNILKLINNKQAATLDFFAGSGTTGHAVVQLNKEDGGNRKYILCTNNENNICEDVTYKRLCNIQEELPHNLKYYKVGYVSKSDEEVYEKLNEHIQEMVNLEEGKEVKVIYDEEEVEKVLEESSCDSSVYIMGGIMLSGKEQKIVEKKRIKIKEVPEIYYRNELKELGEI